MEYQESIIDLLFIGKLGWQQKQITSQLSIPIGSVERAIPDILVAKDNDNRFVVEVKMPDHAKSRKDIDQLVSYMKLLETPIGVYIGKEIEVYYKSIGDGLDPRLILSLDFNPNDENGDCFFSLFSESGFSINSVHKFIREREERIKFDTEVGQMIDHFLSPAFQAEIQDFIFQYYRDRKEEIVKAALEKVRIFVQRNETNKDENIYEDTVTPVRTESSSLKKIRRAGKNNGLAQRYAYNLVESIIKKNAGQNFRKIYHLFGYKNYIEDLSRVSDESRWCMDEEDIIQLDDGTKVVVSNQWGFNGNCKIKMDRLRELAKRYGIDTSLQQN